MGIVVLVAGILLALYGGQVVIRDVYTTRTDEVANLSVEIGESSYWSLDRRIQRPSTVTGKAVVTASATGEPSDVNLFVLDSLNFEKWRQRQPGVSYIVKMPEARDKFAFNFTVLRNDTYHFVFDNYYSSVKKTVAVQILNTYGVVEKQPVVDPTLNYAGLAIIGLGGVITTYGLVMRPELVWSKRQAIR